VRNAVESERFKGKQPLRASVVNPYIEFIRDTLERHPRLRSTRISFHAHLVPRTSRSTHISFHAHPGGNCFMGIESTFYNSVVAGGRPGRGLPC
jgi:hypothetical protein